MEIQDESTCPTSKTVLCCGELNNAVKSLCSARVAAINLTLNLAFRCIVALWTEPSGISGFDLFVHTGQISHRKVFLLSVRYILKRAALRGSCTLKGTNGESVLIQFQPFGGKDQRNRSQSDLVERYACMSTCNFGSFLTISWSFRLVNIHKQEKKVVLQLLCALF